MRIDWLTVIAQIINFLILVWLLKRFLYQPVITAMAMREARIALRLSEAQQREDEADAERCQFRERTEALDQVRERMLSEARDAAEREKRQQLDVARHEIDQQRSRWGDELLREQQALRSELRRELGEAAVAIARRALADLADARLEHQVAETLLRQWDRLPDEARAPFADTDAPLRLVSSFDLDDPIRDRLRAAFEHGSGVVFSHDPGLVCGIALIGAGHRLDWNVLDYLDDAERRVRERLSGSASPGAERA